jgi:uncharacterized protein GlcG (DUF336 family)
VSGKTVVPGRKLPLFIRCRSTKETYLKGSRAVTFLCYICLVGLIAFVPACGKKADNNKSRSGVPPDSASGSESLTAVEVQQIIAQAATRAQALGLPSTIAVVDHEGTQLGVLQMAGAPTTTQVVGGGSGGLENLALPASFAAISKAGTGAFLSTQGNAFSTRTASFIIQEHFPPQVDPSVGGPLFGVQFSSLQCSDVSRTGHPSSTGDPNTSSNFPLGLSADPGGLPLYKNGVAVGGIGVEGNGVYTLDFDPTDSDQSLEEIITAAGTFGFSAAGSIQGDKILVDGVTLSFANANPTANPTTIPYSTLASAPGAMELVVPISSPPSGFVATTVNGVSGSVDPNWFPFIAGTDGGLTASDVNQIIGQAAGQADITRAAIRNPLGSPARVSITVVDTTGTILGIFRTVDAPLFGFDVSAQKARTANFFSSQMAGIQLASAPNNSGGTLTNYVMALANEGIALDGSIAFTDRAGGFMSQPFFPPGATSSAGFGPLSKPLGVWSVFNTGLQFDSLIIGNLTTATAPCTGLSAVPNGFQIFPGSVPLYKAGVHVGAIGVSGDGVDQDDLIASMGSAGFEAPEGIRSDTLKVRGFRLPYVTFPRSPNL